MRYTITGDNLQFVNVQLEEHEVLQSVAGSMAYMTGNMVMEAKMREGIMRGLGRAISGASLFLLEYRSKGGTGIVGLAGSAPGKIVDLDIGKGKWMVQKTGFLGSQVTVSLKVAFQKKLGNIFFGGEGFILQELSGEGIAFVAACGDFNIVDLKPGEKYKVATAKAVAWQESVTYDITAAGGIKTALFGGEGLFVTTLTGPGKIIIQSMTLAELAYSLSPFLTSNG
ncbi:MAG: TIGR00266 family protein [Methanomassiliicoccaceae archaeon]|nr:TIGR00266 family protein [Methanomassiliicoccaceae archaeon]